MFVDERDGKAMPLYYAKGSYRTTMIRVDKACKIRNEKGNQVIEQR
jgi:hypothetical protein